jgi:uncharacterized protein YkwD
MEFAANIITNGYIRPAFVIGSRVLMLSNLTNISLQRRLLSALLGALACTLALAAVHPALGIAGSGCAGATATPAQLTSGEMRSATLCLLNKQRASHGLGSLHSNQALAKAASRHSADMVARDYFSHYTPGGGSIQSRIGGSGYLAGAHSYLFGEVIGGGTSHSGSPKAVVQAWMHSAPHRAAILTGGFHDLGIGVAHGFPGRGQRGATFTVDFGARH